MTPEPSPAEDSRDAQNPAVHAGLFVEQVAIRNFRGISECRLTLEPALTLLIGRNNVGKSRILRAIGIALGALVPERDDLTVGTTAPCTVDIVLAPRLNAATGDVFDDRVRRRLRSIQLIGEDPERERFAWRTTLTTSREGLGVRAEAHTMIWDANVSGWTTTRNGLSGEQASAVSATLIDTRRDLVDELTRRGSPIRRILDDLEVPGDQRELLETELADLGGRIIDSSDSLSAVTEALRALATSVPLLGSPHLSALPPRLEELSRSVSIDFDTGSGRLPVRLHGAGSRSLASLQIQGVLYDRRLGRDRGDLRPHPVTLVEEPEAHLHPQAQFELAEVLEGMTGQVIVSSHSSHLVTEVDPLSIRILQPNEQGLRVVDLHPTTDDDPVRGRRPSLHHEEMEKLRRTVERPLGELLFASCVVIGDGATERALLPALLRHALGSDAHGICVIDPGSMNSDAAMAAVKFAILMDIPWVLFSDADRSGMLAAKRLDRELGAGDENRIVWTGSPGSGTASEQMLLDFDLDLCRAACESVGVADAASLDATSVLQEMKAKKGSIGRALAAELISRYPDRTQLLADPTYWPLPLHRLVWKVTTYLSAGEA